MDVASAGKFSFFVDPPIKKYQSVLVIVMNILRFHSQSLVGVKSIVMGRECTLTIKFYRLTSFGIWVNLFEWPSKVICTRFS